MVDQGDCAGFQVLDRELKSNEMSPTSKYWIEMVLIVTDLVVE